jgi:hypothetical protein
VFPIFQEFLLVLAFLMLLTYRLAKVLFVAGDSAAEVALFCFSTKNLTF